MSLLADIRAWLSRLGWPSLFALACWGSLNAYWPSFEQWPETSGAWVGFLRGLAPFGAMVLAATVTRRSGDPNQHSWPPSAKSWFYYGVVATLAGFGLEWERYGGVFSQLMSFGISYLGYFVIVANAGRGGTGAVEGFRHFNQVTWLLMAGLLAGMTYYARDILVSTTDYGTLTGYNILNLAEEQGMNLPRASGFGRFGAVPGIAGLVMVLQGRGLWRVVGAGAFAGGGFIVWIMQSRGSMYGTFFAILLVFLFQSRSTRWLLLGVAVIGGIAIASEAVPAEMQQRFLTHITRGENYEELKSMTGRVRPWTNAGPHIQDSPIWGWGMQADRVLVGEHVHNTYIYALLSGGILGLFFFSAGLVRAWFDFYELWKSRYPEAIGHQTAFMQAAGILAYFTVRSIPEVSGANWAADFWCMLPILFYFGALRREADSRPRT